MTYLADSNILTSLAKAKSSQYTEVRQSLTLLRKSGEIVCIVPQNLIEFWAVATRPISVNGLSLSVEKTSLEVKKFKRYFHFIDDEPNIFSRWEGLAIKHQVSGKNAHDTRLVAAMLEHKITHLLTFNVKDFARFNEITVVDPKSLNLSENRYCRKYFISGRHPAFASGFKLNSSTSQFARFAPA